MLETTSLSNYIKNLCKNFKTYLFLLLATAVLAATLSLMVNYSIKQLIDNIAYSHSNQINILLLFFAFYKLTYHGMYFFRRLLDIHFNPKIIKSTLTQIYDKTMQHSVHWFESYLSGEISNKISDFQNSLNNIINYIFRSIVNIAIIFMSLLFTIKIHYLPATVLFLFIIIYTPIVYFLLKKQMTLQQNYTQAKQSTIGIINDSISNIFTIKIIGNLKDEMQTKFTPALNNWTKWDKKTRQFDAFWVDSIDTLLVTAMSVAQMYFLATLLQSDTISAGDFVFIATITLNINSELDKFLDGLLFNINPAIAQIKASYKLINQPVTLKTKQNAKNIKKLTGDILYKNVSFSYPNSNKEIFSTFNLTIKQGEKIGIIGHSGAGKTTLVKCLIRYFDVTKGSISINNHNIKDLTMESLIQNISIIPQDTSLLHRSILENLQVANMKASFDDIIDACKKAKIHEDILLMQNGYQSIVGEKGVKLSGGQRQRIAIARALLKNTNIIILDEATSSLDTYTEKLIQQSLEKVFHKKNTTVIAIAHRISTIKNMDKIIIIEKGKIIEQGNPQKLLSNKNSAYSKIWNSQADGFIK
jgi:ATP-binding cassette subfamily B protein